MTVPDYTDDAMMEKMARALAAACHTHKGYPSGSSQADAAREGLSAYLLWLGHRESDLPRVMLEYWEQSEGLERTL